MSLSRRSSKVLEFVVPAYSQMNQTSTFDPEAEERAFVVSLKPSGSSPVEECSEPGLCRFIYKKGATPLLMGVYPQVGYQSNNNKLWLSIVPFESMQLKYRYHNYIKSILVSAQSNTRSMGESAKSPVTGPRNQRTRPTPTTALSRDSQLGRTLIYKSPPQAGSPRLLPSSVAE